MTTRLHFTGLLALSLTVTTILDVVTYVLLGR
jgi:hypothetical protein